MAGARFLAGKLQLPRRREAASPRGGTVDELIRTAPVVGTDDMTVAQAARLMTERNRDYVVIPRADHTFGVLTDADIRSRVVAAGEQPDIPVAHVMTPRARTIVTGTPAADALMQILEHDLTCLPVVDPAGRLLGAVGPGDFISAPGGASVSLRNQIGRANSRTALYEQAQRMPFVVADLVRRGQPSHEVTAVLSLVHDAVVRRALELALADHPELDGDKLTWLSLGSNARREAVLSSDVDSAVAFDESIADRDEIARYLVAFAEVDDILRGCGLRIDANGAIASSALFARTHAQWRAAAAEWLRNPLENKGMIMTSLMLDGRPIWGDRGLSGVAEVFGDLRSHPGTLRLLLAESLSTKARIRSMRDVLARRGGTFDIKAHALTPLVNIARWASLSVESLELDTRSRLRVAAGSPMLTEDNARVLIEVFDVLQKIRIDYQVAQLDQREAAGDILTMRRLSPLDRSLVAQGVREVSAIQRRMTNLSHYTPVAE
ncbi:DUF294 nucleotidyltransferase-like domain-containing protein [Williamsia sp.]|uniref:DUF294 nucleotidyltransferase-like domain-containing protein n=1 Tax=Williamsia sp. TaxID=1872085 RepID=UPI0025F595F8|nr:DUF294 nucleotidyltransferase-like domain-containing protein [Williamsia sp.]